MTGSTTSVPVPVPVAASAVVGSTASRTVAAAGFGRATPRGLDDHLGGVASENYRVYELNHVAPYCGRHVLEVGSGLGEFAERLRELGGVERVTVSDADPMCLAALTDRFAGRDDVEVLVLDVTQPFSLPARVPPVDTVAMMNVLEHVADDVGTLRRLARVVGPGGRLVIWVPGYEALYGDFDRVVGHVRRYTPATVRRSAEFAGLAVDCARPVNLLGGLAWWAAVRLGGQTTPSRRWVRAYDRVVVPATRALERVVRVPFGQSVLCVATVPGGPAPGEGAMSEESPNERPDGEGVPVGNTGQGARATR